ncbi:MAG: RluA family pseudouridine synthase, partial [Desulfococcaceae bacterium]
GRRMDALVADRLRDCPRSLAARLIREGLIRVDDEVKKPGYRLRTGDRIAGRVPPPSPAPFGPEPIPLDVLWEDRDVLVISKPPGLVVHPAPGHETGTLVNALLHHIPDLEGIGGTLRPGIVHRLDKDTSGVLVVAKTARAQSSLSTQFKARSVTKEYLALVYGRMPAAAGRINRPVGRHPVDRKRMSTAGPNARPAETLWTQEEILPATTLLSLDLKTGRTHQIRVHCAAIGHPVVGDPVYGSPKAMKGASPAVQRLLEPMDRQMLHARRIRFTHPATQMFLEFEAPLPSDMAELLTRLRELQTEAENP